MTRFQIQSSSIKTCSDRVLAYGKDAVVLKCIDIAVNSYI
jgi:hypothetical protein